MSLASVPMEDSTNLEEVEALKAIYIREMEVSYCPSTKQPRCISINLHPATADNADAQYVCLTLVIKLPLTYPDELPEISIRNPRGLSDEDLERVTSDLLTKAKESQGNAMLFELIELAKEHLTMGNKPRCLCAICLYEFSEEDVFTKTECYHHFHSHCLARYVESVAAPTEGDTVPLDAPTKVLCPVCREPISGHQDVNAPPPVRSESAAEFQVDAELKRRQETMAATFEKQKSRGGIIDIEAEKNKFLIEISTTTSVVTEVSESHAEPTKPTRVGATTSKQPNRATRNQTSNRSSSARQPHHPAQRGDDNMANGKGDLHHQQLQDQQQKGNDDRQQGEVTNKKSRNRYGGRGRRQPFDHEGSETGDRFRPDGDDAGWRGGRGRRNSNRGARRGSFTENGDQFDHVDIATYPAPDIDLTTANGDKVQQAVGEWAEEQAEVNGGPQLNSAGGSTPYPRGRRGNGNRRSYAGNRRQVSESGNSMVTDDVQPAMQSNRRQVSESGNSMVTDDVQPAMQSSRSRNYSDIRNGDFTDHHRHRDNADQLDEQRRGGRGGRGYQRRPRRPTFQQGGREGSSTDYPNTGDQSVDGPRDGQSGHRGGGRGLQDGPRINNRRYWSSSRNDRQSNLNDSSAHVGPNEASSDGNMAAFTEQDGRFKRGGGGGGQGGRGRPRSQRSGRGWDARRHGPPTESPGREVHPHSETSVDGSHHSRHPSSGSQTGGSDPATGQESRRMVLTGPPTKASFGKCHPTSSPHVAPTNAAVSGGGAFPVSSKFHRNREPRHGDQSRPPPPGFQGPPASTHKMASGDLQALESAAASLSVGSPPPGFDGGSRYPEPSPNAHKFRVSN